MYKRPEITPIAEHPRLFLRKKHLPELREKMSSPELKDVIDRLKFFSDFDEDQVHHHNSPGVKYIIEANALKYLLENDRSAGEKAKRLTLKYIVQGFNEKYQDISREIGRLMLASAIAYDWCFDLFNDEERDFLIMHLKRLAELMECGYPPVNEGAFVGHTSEWMLMRDMLGTGVAIYDEYPEMYNLAAGRIFEEFVPARNFIYPSGWHHQGDAYGGVRFEGELFPTWIFGRMGFGNIFDERQGNVAYQWIYTRRPDRKLLRDGDTDPPVLGLTDYPRLYFIYLMTASFYKNPYFKHQWLREKVTVKDKDILFSFLFADTKLEPKSIEELPLTRYFDEPAGIMVARTGWDDENGSKSPTVVAQMKIGSYQFNNHQHLDAGAFQLYYKGLLANDSGSYKGSSGKYHSPHNKYYFKRTIAHNALLVYDPDELKKHPNVRDGNLTYPNVNDGGQRWPNEGRPPMTLEELRSKGYKRAEVLAHAIGPDKVEPDYSYLKGDLTEAYSDKIKQYARSFVFLNLKNTDHPAVLIVLDRVVVSDPSFKKYWLLHSIEEPSVEGTTTTISRIEHGYNGQLVNETLLPSPERQNINKVGGKGKEYWVFGTNYRNDHPGTDEQGDWRIEVSPTTSEEEELFLNVMQVKDYDGPQPLTTKKVESELLVGSMIDEWLVMFSKNGAAIQERFELDVQGEKGTMKLLITDLSPGEWVIEQADSTVIQKATDREGVLHFTAQNGIVQVYPKGN